MIQIPPHIQKLSPYKSGKPIDELAREKGLTQIVKLASNENPLGPSPKAVEAIKNALSELHRYPDPACFEAITHLSEKYGVPRSRIFLASGSDAIIQYLIMGLSGDDDELLSSVGTFIGWRVNLEKLNKRGVYVPLKHFGFDLEGILASITSRTKIIYLANPNNPTGTMFGKAVFESFLQQVPEHILVIYDEAYHLYASQFDDYPDGLDYLRPNVVVLRTFSKSFGLAGLRLGVAFASEEIVQAMLKARLPFEPGYPAQAAALAALDDTAFLTRTRDLHTASFDMLRAKFDELGIEYTNSAANFTMLIFPSEEFASAFNSACLENGLILRHVKSFGLPNGVRINTGTIPETEFAIQVIERVYSALKKRFPIEVINS